MDAEGFANLILDKFSYNPIKSQEKLISKLSDFVFNSGPNEIFILEGYAGTGKTTVVSALVKNLSFIRKRSVLLAPTGRAAKVFSSYSGKNAFTIHKKIYELTTGHDGSLKLVLAQSNYKNTIFLVDEASMIPDQSAGSNDSFFSDRNLLHDLIDYVFQGENCRLILIGDSAQLPPVGINISPALDLKYLSASFQVQTRFFQLKEVVRQSLESGILYNATNIRNIIGKNEQQLIFDTDQFTDIIPINGVELEDHLNSTFSGKGLENAVIITRSNKRANIFNQEIRHRILFRENEIDAGDLMMVVKNNYFWSDKKEGPAFIANGDIIELLKIEKYEEIYDHRFAEATIRLIDYPGQHELRVKLMLDTIMINGPSLSYNDQKNFFAEVLKDYENIPSRRKRIEEVKNNPYYNALQVKFGYALTCHKTQGGQWKHVFIDQGYLTEEHINQEYFRWLYTALTRATEKVYLVNFHERFFQ
jgi:exodeoxyribonuclease-5